MEKHIFNEQTGIGYTLQGDYYLPDLACSDEKERPIGLWGQRHVRYLKQHRKVLYYNLLTIGKLNDYLTDINIQAEEMFNRLVKQMAECEYVSEQLKANLPMEWVQKMNNIRNRVAEITNNNFIFV